MLVSNDVIFELRNCLPPAYMCRGIFQVGEPYDHDEEGQPLYSTFLQKCEGWECMGIYRKGETIHTLMQFFANEEHLKRICKAGDKGEEEKPIFYDVKSIELNMRYKECSTLLKHLVKYYKIKCYYK